MDFSVCLLLKIRERKVFFLFQQKLNDFFFSCEATHASGFRNSPCLGFHKRVEGKKIDAIIGFAEIHEFFNMPELCKHVSKTNIEKEFFDEISSP